MKSININTDVKIRYCDNCGTYLGDEINGHLYKFGREILNTHTCKKVDEHD